MSKPEDIPQDVWDAAVRIGREFSAIYPHEAAALIAPEIMAERERNAQFIQDYLEEYLSVTGDYKHLPKVCSAAVRKRGLRNVIAAHIKNNSEA